jgi:hypothetical protein
VEEGGGAHLYAFVQNSAISLVDSYGTESTSTELADNMDKCVANADQVNTGNNIPDEELQGYVSILKDKGCPYKVFCVCGKDCNSMSGRGEAKGGGKGKVCDVKLCSDKYTWQEIGGGFRHEIWHCVQACYDVNIQKDCKSCLCGEIAAYAKSSCQGMKVGTPEWLKCVRGGAGGSFTGKSVDGKYTYPCTKEKKEKDIDTIVTLDFAKACEKQGFPVPDGAK